MKIKLLTIHVLIISLLFYACSGANSGNESNGNTTDAKEEVSLNDLGQQSPIYLVTSPGEMMAAFKKEAGNINWEELASFNEKTAYESDVKLALNMGIRIADALVAVVAKDGRKLLQMSNSINEMGQSLNVGTLVDQSKKELAGFLVDEEWDKLAAAVENLQADMQNEINTQNKKDLVELASIGGWLEGMKIVSGHVSKNYQAENTEFLKQAKLFDYYLEKLNKLGADTQADPVVEEVLTAVTKLKNIMTTDSALSKEQVTQIYTISQEVVSRIEA
ncbi:MAG: hypothetical protein HC880_06965 [Bacteroidia bacterium]|nr:hypothetical protein [Bacteroidia bacterium]